MIREQKLRNACKASNKRRIRNAKNLINAAACKSNKYSNGVETICRIARVLGIIPMNFLIYDL